MTRDKRFYAGVLFSLIMILSMDQAGYAQSGTIDFNQSKWTSLIGQKLYHGGPSNTLSDTDNGVDFIVTFGEMNITAGMPTGGMLFFSPIISAGNNDESGQVLIRFSTSKSRVRLQASHDEHPVHTPYYMTVKFYRDFTPSNPLHSVDVPWNSGAFSTVEYSNSDPGIKMVIATTMFAENNIDNIIFDGMDSAQPEGTFNFDDGTAQGWTLAGAYNGADQQVRANNFTFGWKDQVDYPDAPGKDPAGDSHGSIQMTTANGHGISDPGHTWFIMQFHSPDLSSNTVWQNAKGYTVEIAECMAVSATLYRNLYVVVHDLDLGTDRNFYTGTAVALSHDTYGDATANWNHVSFDWSGASGFPTRYTIKEIFIDIWGRLSNSFSGGVYVDRVAPIPGEARPQTPAAPTNLVAVQLPPQVHVTWQDNSNDETGFKLEMRQYTPLPGNWQVMATLGPNVTSYQINGLQNERTYHFRVAAYNANGSSAYSNTDTLYCGNQFVWLRVGSPNGGETWSAGSNRSITWTSSVAMRPDHVNIHYSTDGGSSWVFPPVATNVLNLGAYSWTIPATLSSNCLVKVESADNVSFYDLSDAPFTISAATGPVLSVSEDTLDFGTNLSQSAFTVDNTGDGTLTWTVSQDPQKPWVTSIDPSGGSNHATVTVTVDRSQVSGDGDLGALSVSSNGGTDRVVLRIAKQEQAALPDDWNFKASTGNNATIILPVSANPNIDGQPLSVGDYVGVFTPAGLCCGWSQWAGANLSITAWGDDSQTAETDGFTPGEQIQYSVYRFSTQSEWRTVTAGYSMGTGLYSADGLMILNRFDVSATVSLGIQFSRGWNMFSVNLTPVPPDLVSVMAPVQDDLVIVKNGKGKTYIPEFQINDIGDVDFRQGYKAYLNRGVGLVVVGTPVSPATPIELLSGWSMIGFLPNSSVPVETALASIQDHLVIAKNNSGNTYIPQYGINTLGSMEPGLGYQVYLSSAGTLVYPSGGMPKAVRARTANSKADTTGHFQFISNTGENATIVIPADSAPKFSNGTALSAGDEIGVLTSGGLCCGGLVWEEKNAAITVWGDNTVTEEVDGFLAGDTLRLAVWKSGAGREYPAAVIFRDGDPVVYVQDGISVVVSLVADLVSGVTDRNGTEIPDDCGLSVNYPNPFNSETVIEYRMPVSAQVELTVFDLNGRPVRTLIQESKPAGYCTARWDGTDETGRSVASGIYYYRIQMKGKEGGGFTYKAGRKMILMR